MKKITAAITGVGAYLPDYVLDNFELSKMVDTSDEWIMTRVGIKTRRILKGEGLGTSYMAERAVNDLLEKTNTDPLDVDMVICATVTPDMFFQDGGGAWHMTDWQGFRICSRAATGADGYDELVIISLA